MARAVSPKRLLLVVLLTLAASVVFVPGAAAGNFDEEKMGCAGEGPATCPTGTVGQPYSLTIYLSPPDGGRGEDFDCATFHVTSGTFPPGLSISDEGYITGTPTQAGTYDFYLTVKYDKPGCAKAPSDDRFIMNINPGVPKLTIGPESAPVGTAGASYSLQMSANLPDAKTWSISAGALPPGLTLNPATGMISGTPTAAGSFHFTVLAVIDAQRSDTKALTIDVRMPVAITASSPLAASSQPTRWEVGVPLRGSLAATGGTGAYTWTVTGTLPTGLALAPDGSLRGRVLEAGDYRFAVAVRDTEGRVASYEAVLSVAPRLAFDPTVRLVPAIAGLRYRAQFLSAGGIAPTSWRILRGSLPRGVRFAPKLGLLIGKPQQAGRFKLRVQVVDALGVRAGKWYLLRVQPASAKRKKAAKQRRSEVALMEGVGSLLSRSA